MSFVVFFMGKMVAGSVYDSSLKTVEEAEKWILNKHALNNSAGWPHRYEILEFTDLMIHEGMIYKRIKNIKTVVSSKAEIIEDE